MMNWWIVFFWYGWPTKDVYPFFQPGPLSEILTISNLQHAVSRIWTCAEPEFRLCWMKLCGSDNYYTTVEQNRALTGPGQSLGEETESKAPEKCLILYSQKDSRLTNFSFAQMCNVLCKNLILNPRCCWSDIL